MSKTIADIINLAEVASNPMRAAHLRTDLDNTASSLVLLQVYANQALQQTVIDPAGITGVDKELLPQVRQHQSAMQRNAAHTLQTLAPTVISTLTDVIGFGSMVGSFTDAMMPLLPSILERPEARAQVLALMTRLELESHSRELAAREVDTQLALARRKLDADRENLDADATRAMQLIGDKGGALGKLQSDIDDLRRKIDGEIAGVVLAALVVVGGGVTITVGALATLPTGFTSGGVVLAGIGMVVGGATGLTAAASLLGVDNGKLAALYQETARVGMTLAVIKAVSGQVEGLVDASQGLADAAEALATQWSSIHGGITSFRDEITRASDAGDVARIIAGLKLAQQDWKAVVNQAQGLTTRLVDLAPTSVKSVLNKAA